MATWPATLPLPNMSGYQVENGGKVLRTDFDSGPARQRLRFTVCPDDLSVNWKFKPNEIAIFKAFFKTDIHEGVDWFLITLNMGYGLLEYEARFVSGKYQSQILPGMNWIVSAKLDVKV